MTQEHLTIRFTVPLIERSDGSGAPLVFNRWLPLGHDLGLTFDHGSCTGLLWFGTKLTYDGSDMTPERIPNVVNLMVHAVYVDIAVAVEHDLFAYMKGRDFQRQPTAEEQPLADRYESHGAEVIAALEDGVNRLLAFARVEKGQYWLRPYNLNVGQMAGYAVAFNAHAKGADDEWFRWNSTQITRLSCTGPTDSDPRFIRENDWQQARDFVAGARKPTLTKQLLAGAEFLADSGAHRAALTEAISALEVALHVFARSPQFLAVLSPSLNNRLATESLPRLVVRLGLSASLDVLLPMLLPEDVVPVALLKLCRDAVAERQTIVHGGQREVPATRLVKHLRAVRQLCETLLHISAT